MGPGPEPRVATGPGGRRPDPVRGVLHVPPAEVEIRHRDVDRQGRGVDPARLVEDGQGLVEAAALGVGLSQAHVGLDPGGIQLDRLPVVERRPGQVPVPGQLVSPFKEALRVRPQEEVDGRTSRAVGLDAGLEELEDVLGQAMGKGEDIVHAAPEPDRNRQVAVELHEARRDHDLLVVHDLERTGDPGHAGVLTPLRLPGEGDLEPSSGVARRHRLQGRDQVLGQDVSQGGEPVRSGLGTESPDHHDVRRGPGRDRIVHRGLAPEPLSDPAGELSDAGEELIDAGLHDVGVDHRAGAPRDHAHVDDRALAHGDQLAADPEVRFRAGDRHLPGGAAGLPGGRHRLWRVVALRRAGARGLHQRGGSLPPHRPNPPEGEESRLQEAGNRPGDLLPPGLLALGCEGCDGDRPGLEARARHLLGPGPAGEYRAGGEREENEGEGRRVRGGTVHGGHQLSLSSRVRRSPNDHSLTISSTTVSKTALVKPPGAGTSASRTQRLRATETTQYSR